MLPACDPRPIHKQDACATQGVIIRDAVEADLPAIVEIYNAAIRGRISSAQLEEVSVEQRLPWFREHAAESYPLWVAKIDGQTAGWLSFHPFIRRQAYRGTVEISIYVHEKFRGAGLGRTLLEEAIARAPSLKISSLVGCIFRAQRPESSLVRAHGLRTLGVSPAHR